MEEKTADQLASLRQITLVVYVLQALSLFGGVTGIIAVVISYVKRDEAVGTLYESHFDWQIRTFWWGLLWACVGMALIVVLVGLPLLFATWVWAVYRVVKGWLKWSDKLPVHPA
jgi:uncharacterized membrane protein